MKHGKRFWQKKLNRSPEHRRALLKNLITSLVVNEQIQTTLAKAKFMARSADLMIEHAKKGLMKQVEKKVFRKDETIPIIMQKLVPRYEKRFGGYTRILRNGFRRSGTDRAPLAIVEFVDCPKDTIHRLAQVQLPTLKEDLKKTISEKYRVNPVQLFDPISGEPVTILQHELKRELDEKTIIKLSKRERGIQKLIDKYERSMSSYPSARAKDGVDKTRTVGSLDQTFDDLSLESRPIKENELKPADEKDSKQKWFKWF